MDEDRTVTMDMVIKNGQVYDSETRTLKKQDIGVSQGKIAAISGEMMTDERTKMIDADGCIVAPGLIPGAGGWTSNDSRGSPYVSERRDHRCGCGDLRLP